MSIRPYLCTYSCPHIHIHSLSSGDKTCSQIAKLEATKLMNSAVGAGAGALEELLEAVLWLSSDCFCHLGNHMRVIHKDKWHLFCECLNLVYTLSAILSCFISFVFFSLSLSYLIFFSVPMQISLLKFCCCSFTFLYIKKTLN